MLFSFFFVLILPFVSFAVLLFHGPFFQSKSGLFKQLFPIVSVFNLFLTVLLIVVCFFEYKTVGYVSEYLFGTFYLSHPGYLPEFFTMFNRLVLFNAPMSVTYCFVFDSATVVMLCVVVFVSTLVQLFSTEYMAADLLIIRFFMFLNFFTLCMLLLVTAGSFVQMFVGWEGVGLASFFLIGFWFSRKQAVKCAIKAVIVNRVGDCALLLTFAILIFLFGDTSYLTIFSAISGDSAVFESLTLSGFFTNYTQVDLVFTESSYLSRIFLVFLNSVYIVDLVALLLCVGAFAKSAQFGLHTWLPDAMEGPTPVSALIHAATMVTAGVFLLIRAAPIIAFSCSAQTVLIVTGSLTALFGASTAFAQFDIKKIIAYSTCSQLGYMVVACGLLSFDLALFHLATHAFFKAGLFMCAGLIIHALNNEQDVRRFGGLVHIMPVTYFSMFLCSACLGGFPFFSGYFSKDAIMESSFLFGLTYWLSFMLLVLAACFTVAYSVRLFYYVFWRTFAGFRPLLISVHETNRSSVAVLLLSFISVFLGFLMVKGLYAQFFFYTSLYGGVLANSALLGFSQLWDSVDLGSRFFYQTTDVFNLFHVFLPIIILFILVAVGFFVWGLVSAMRSSGVVVKKALIVLTLEVLWRHIFVFLSRAWLIDVFYTKLVRLFVFFNKIFIFQFIEQGLFEFFLSLSVSRTIGLFGRVFNLGQDGRLSSFFESSVFKICCLFLVSFLLV